MVEQENLPGEIEKLRADLELSKRKKLFYDNLRKTVPITGIAVFVTMVTVYFTLYKQPVVLLVGIFYFIIAIVYPLTNLGKSVELEIDALQSEISLKSTGTDAIEERAERLFKAHEIDLKKYYEQSLRQSSVIFFVGIFCVLVGFIFLGGAIYFIQTNTFGTSLQLKILTAVLGTVSGVLTNFVAVIYLRIFTQTIKSFTTFHNKLVSTNHLHFANFLISKIDNDQLRYESLKSMCDKITEKV